MWKELWTKHRSGFLFAVGMVCFLAAGLLARSLTLHQGKIEEAKPQVFQAEKARETPEKPPTKISEKTPEKAPEKKVFLIQEQETPLQENMWVLYITGKVRRPGVYKLPAGSRLFQLVEAAGGLEGSADPVAVNMASSLEDGLHVHIPARQAPTPGERTASVPANSGFQNTAQPSARQARSASQNKQNKTKTSGPINVNRASEEELISLKGIGPALARNIVVHRQKNGPFRTVDDLLQVKGIGEKKLEGLRGDVTVGP